MRVYHNFFLLLGSGSTFPEVGPDPSKWYGSDRIRIRNTDFYTFFVLFIPCLLFPINVSLIFIYIIYILSLSTFDSDIRMSPSASVHLTTPSWTRRMHRPLKMFKRPPRRRSSTSRRLTTGERLQSWILMTKVWILMQVN